MKRKLLKILTNYLQNKADPDKIKKYINQKDISKAKSLDKLQYTKIKIAVVQERVQLLKGYKEYIEYMYTFIKDASDNGAQLICFPEYNGLLLLGMIPCIEILLKKTENKKSNKKSNKNKGKRKIRTGEDIDVSELITVLTPFIKNTFTTIFSELAKAFGIYIMAGSVLIEENGYIRNRAYLFNPGGDIAGIQDKAHLMELEKKLGITPSRSLQVFDTQIGRLAFPICMDATYFETFKILKHMGAQIIMVPIANMEEYNHYPALRGIWPRVQESGIYGLKSALVGSLYNISLTGRAAILAPLSLTHKGDGIIKEAQTYDSNEVLIAELDLNLLSDYTNSYFSDTNPEVYKKYMPQIYTKD